MTVTFEEFGPTHDFFAYTGGLVAASDTEIWWKPKALESKAWEKLNPTQAFIGLNDVWSDPAYPDVIYASIGNGLLYTTAPHELFRAYSFRPERHPPPVALRFSSTAGSDGNPSYFLVRISKVILSTMICRGMVGPGELSCFSNGTSTTTPIEFGSGR